MNKDFSLLDVLKTLGRWKRYIIMTTVAVALISIVGTLMMPNYYQASTTFYAAHPDLAQPDMVGGDQAAKYIYGTSDDLDRLFSIANSSAIRDFIVEKFNLWEHYDIDKSTKKGPSKMAKKFNKLYQTERTKYDAMTLSMEDVDPVLSLSMVTAAREKLSELSQSVIKSSQSKSMETAYQNITFQEAALATINDSLTNVKKKYGVVDSGTQGEVFASMITEASSSLDQRKAQLESMTTQRMPRDSIRKVKSIIAGLESKKSSLNKSVTNYNEGILAVLALEQQQRRLYDEISLEKERYKKLKSSFDSPFTTLHIVERESLPVDKSRPKRSIYVLGFTLLAFLLSCLGAIVIDGVKEVNWREIYNG